jgi:hypothetical protein
MSGAAPPSAARAPSWPIAALHLAALWAFAFVQPLFDLLSRNADFFIARGNTAGDILRFAVALVIVPPALMIAAEGLAALVSRGARAGLHLVLVAGLAGAFALELLQRVAPAGAAVLLPAAVLAGAAFAVAYARVAGMRSFVTVLGAAPLIFPALFLAFSPIAELLRPEPTVRAATGSPARTPVVLLVFDELPTTSLMAGRGRIDAERYPSFARLARTSTWYANATTVSDSTTRAIPAILSGLRPSQRRRLPTSRTYPRSLFSLLGSRWEQSVTEPLTDVCPPAICREGSDQSAAQRMRALASDLGIVTGHLLLPTDLAASLPPIDRGWADFGEGDRPINRGLGTVRPGERPAGDWWAERVAEAERGIAAIGPQRDRAPLHVIHVITPHVPWRYFPSGMRYPEPGPGVIPGTIPLQGWDDDRYLVRQGWQRHLLQVGFADRLLGRVLRNLRRSGLWDRALVVVAADHGGAFRPGVQRRPVLRANFADIAGVPLFVKRPGQRAGRVDPRPARTIDVLPTIARTIGAGARWRFDGRPLDERSPERTLRVTNQDERRDLTMSVRRFVRMRDAQLAQQLRLFPPGRASLMRLGPNARLIGRPVAALRRGPDAGGGSIDRAAAYRRVQPRTGVVPAYVTGRLPAREPAGRPLAVAIDGRIRAVAQSWRQAGQARFSALVAPSALTAGGHTVEVFAVGRGDRLRLLARLPGS